MQIEKALFQPSDWTELTTLLGELQDTQAKRQMFRTETEARISVLDDLRRPTPAAKYWQCVREQSVMAEQLVLLSFDYRRNEVEIKRHVKALESAAGFDAEDAQINLDECLFKRANMLAVAKDRLRELQMWSKIKAELDDGSFDTQNCDTHQLISYTARFATRLSILDPAHMSGDEWSNLIGQLNTSIRRCHETGAMSELMTALMPGVKERLQKEKLLPCT